MGIGEFIVTTNFFCRLTKLWKGDPGVRNERGHINTKPTQQTMKILSKVTGMACLAIGLNLALPQTAEAQFHFRRSSGNDENLVERLAGLEQYSTLVEAVTAAGLVDALAEIEEATVFAPTNEAFAKIPEATLTSLLNNEAALTNLLTYHVVPNERLFSFRLGNRSFTALNEGTLTAATAWRRSFWWWSSEIKINDSTVVEPNLRASNGVIHGIDTVLDPEFMAPQTLLELVGGNENFSTLALLIEQAGFSRLLDSEHLELTVFAPTNEAFANLPGEVLEAVQNDRDLLRFVLKNHILRGAVESTELTTGEVRTVGRTMLDVVVGEEAITVGPATVIDPDLLASNGVAHVIDQVLVPEILETLVGVVDSRDELSTFKAALDIAGFTPFFDQDSRFFKWTIFAPNNEAFAAVPADALAALLDDRRALRRVLLRHVAFGKITSNHLADGGVVRTIGGRLSVDFSEDGVTFNGSPLVEADLEASNGIIHIVGGVIPERTPSNDDEDDEDADGGDEEGEGQNGDKRGL